MCDINKEEYGSVKYCDVKCDLK